MPPAWLRVGEVRGQRACVVDDVASLLVVARQARGGARVLVDWLQRNDAARSTAAPYWLRARRLPRVSTPVGWEEVEACAGGCGELAFGPADVLDRLDAHGDQFAPLTPGCG